MLTVTNLEQSRSKSSRKDFCKKMILIKFQYVWTHLEANLDMANNKNKNKKKANETIINFREDKILSRKGKQNTIWSSSDYNLNIHNNVNTEHHSWQNYAVSILRSQVMCVYVTEHKWKE